MKKLFALLLIITSLVSQAQTVRSERKLEFLMWYYEKQDSLVAAGWGASGLPSQTGNSGKVLTTNGTSPSWSASATYNLTSPTNGEVLKYADGTFVNGNTADSLQTASSTPAHGNFYFNPSATSFNVRYGTTWFKFKPSGITSGSSTYDSDAEAYFTAAGVTTTGDKNALNTFVLGLKSAGLWTKGKALYPLYGTSFSSAKFNLFNTSLHQLTQTGTGTFASGFTNTAGSTDGLYLDVSPSTYSGLYTMVATIKTNVDCFCTVFGVSDPTDYYFIIPRYTGNLYMNAGNNTAGSAIQASSNSIGRYYLTSNTADYEAYMNGSSLATRTRTNTTTSNPFIIGNGGNAAAPSTHKVSIVALFDALSDSEVAMLDGLISSLETSLGR